MVKLLTFVPLYPFFLAFSQGNLTNNFSSCLWPRYYVPKNSKKTSQNIFDAKRSILNKINRGGLWKSQTFPKLREGGGSGNLEFFSKNNPLLIFMASLNSINPTTNTLSLFEIIWDLRICILDFRFWIADDFRFCI